jgi:hypothetical protein
MPQIKIIFREISFSIVIHNIVYLKKETRLRCKPDTKFCAYLPPHQKGNEKEIK